MTNKGTAVTLNFSWLGLLGIVLVVLKALGYIAWPWLWVLAPFWIPTAIAGMILVGLIFFGFGVQLYEAWRRKRARKRQRDKFRGW